MNNQEQNNPDLMEQDNLVKEAKNSSNTNDSTDTNAVSFGDSQMQTKEEFPQNKKSNNTVTSSDQDTQSYNEEPIGSDRAGTTERKTYGDTELNKGLEVQAKEEEL